MKDLFIDNNRAMLFAKPPNDHYRKLIDWLKKNDDNDSNNNAYLVVSNDLIREYGRTGSSCSSKTCIWVLIDILTREKRLNKITKDQVDDFKSKNYTKTIQKCLICNFEDRELIPVVLLSERRYALIYDIKFTRDLKLFTQFIVKIEKEPQDLQYDA